MSNLYHSTSYKHISYSLNISFCSQWCILFLNHILHPPHPTHQDTPHTPQRNNQNRTLHNRGHLYTLHLYLPPPPLLQKSHTGIHISHRCSRSNWSSQCGRIPGKGCLRWEFHHGFYQGNHNNRSGMNSTHNVFLHDHHHILVGKGPFLIGLVHIGNLLKLRCKIQFSFSQIFVVKQFYY